jgi:lysozyme family protein
MTQAGSKAAADQSARAQPPAYAKQAGWARVVLPDSPAREPIPSGKAYVTIDLLDFELARARSGLSKFYPVFLSSLTFPQRLARLSSERIVDASKPVDDMTVSAPAGGPRLRRTLCAQVPFHGKLEGHFHLVALRSETALKSVMRLANAFQAGRAADTEDAAQEAAPGADAAADEGGEDPYESVLATVMVAKATEIAGKIAARLATKAVGQLVSTAADMIAEQDGRKSVRAAMLVDELPAETGDYVVCNLPAARAGEQMGYEPKRRKFRVGKKTIRNLDFALIRVRMSTRHDSIDLIPGLGEDYRSLMEILIADGEAEGALRRFCRRARASDHLIESDRQELIALVEAKARDVAGGFGAANEDDPYESILTSPALRKSLQSLASLWTQRLKPPVVPTPAPGPQTADPAPQAAPAVTPEPAQPQSSRFPVALEFALKWEGGYVNHPADRGGPTNKGVTQRVYDAWREAQEEAPQSVEHITHDEMHAIYQANYWQAGRCERFAPNLDWLMFDVSVNSGPAAAARLMQRALGRCGVAVKVDGVIGQRTIAAAETLAPERLGKAFITERFELFDRIVASRPNQSVFLKGWRNRTKALALATGLAETENVLENTEGQNIVPEPTAFAEYID